MIQIIKPKRELRTARWRVIVLYRTDNGLIDVEHGVEELSEVEQLVERGPDWNAIERIDITLARISHADLTIEQAEGL